MTTIIKSNATYTGSGTLGSIAQITQSAQDIYNAYEARVTTDGGIIQEPASCLEAIERAVDRGYFFGTEIAISARWGIRLSSTNIAKFYNLGRGPDGVSVGLIPLDTVSESYALAALDTKKITFSGPTLLRGNSMAHVAATIYTVTAMRAAFTSAGEAWSYFFGNLTRVDINGVGSKFATSPEYGRSSGAVNGYLTEMSEQRISGVQDGVYRKTTASSFTPIVAGATADITLDSGFGANQDIVEYWHLHTATIADVMSLTADIAARS